MIKHVVMWNIRADGPGGRTANIERLKRGFESLNGRIPGLLLLEIGVDTSANLVDDIVFQKSMHSNQHELLLCLAISKTI